MYLFIVIIHLYIKVSYPLAAVIHLYKFGVIPVRCGNISAYPPNFTAKIVLS